MINKKGLQDNSGCLLIPDFLYDNMTSQSGMAFHNFIWQLLYKRTIKSTLTIRVHQPMINPLKIICTMCQSTVCC